MGSIKRKCEDIEHDRPDAGLKISNEVISKIIAAKSVLQAHRSSDASALLSASMQLKALGKLTTSVLRETQIGRLVGQIAKEAASEEVRQSLQELHTEWKIMFRDTTRPAKIVALQMSANPSESNRINEFGNVSVRCVEPLTVELYRKRLVEQKKYHDCKPGSRSTDNCLQDPPTLPAVVTICAEIEPLPERTKDGHFLFPDFPDFKPNLSPKQVLQAGSFGGTYFRNISSAVTGIHYKGTDVIKEFPHDWFEGLRLEEQVLSQDYRKTVNKYRVACGGSLGMWETSGWIASIDPYGWFQWYCRFFLGRRTSDDTRQVDRWLKGQGPKGRWRLQLMNKIIKDHTRFDDIKVSPVIRQVLLHWAYELTSADFDAYRELQLKCK